MDHTTPLGSLLGSEVRARIVVHFVVHPRSRLSARELGRRAGVPGKRSLQIEVDRLAGLGLLRRDRVGRAVHISRDHSHAQWGALASLAQEYAPTLILREALAGVPGVEAAFVFGSYARGDARPDSDIDLFVYGDEIPEGAVGKALLDAALVLDRPVDAKRYDAPAFQRDARPGASFLPGALSGPKLWLVGSADRLPDTGAAAA
jgi:predicted nucleotidyltransferase